MCPDPGDKARRPKGKQLPPQVRDRPSSDDAHEIAYFKRHVDDDPTEVSPGREFLARCPVGVRAKFRAVLTHVAAAPPKRFAGGGYWEAMKGDMRGYFEVRVDGPKRHHYRLFCRLDYEAKGMSKPLLVVITGLDKPFRTELTAGQYANVRELGDEYLERPERSLG